MASADDKSISFREDKVDVCGVPLAVVRGGSGKPLLILHEELGWPGWLGWNAALAEKRSLIIPMHPGFGRTPPPEWIRNIRDLAGLYSCLLREQKLAPIDVIGFSMGGWIAAEMAACNPDQFRKMVLVAPLGIKPPTGEILDVFQLMAPDQLRVSVLNPAATPEYGALYGGQGPTQFELWEEARASTARLAWMPYLHNPSLPHLLRVAANLPTLLLWGSDDAIVPRSAGETYREAIAGAKLKVIDQCGHRPEVEKRAEFVREVEAFLA